ncbi:MAG: hypothetical protein ACQEV7_07585 [Bacillota bacterium]
MKKLLPILVVVLAVTLIFGVNTGKAAKEETYPISTTNANLDPGTGGSGG